MALGDIVIEGDTDNTFTTGNLITLNTRALIADDIPLKVGQDVWYAGFQYESSRLRIIQLHVTLFPLATSSSLAAAGDICNEHARRLDEIFAMPCKRIYSFAMDKFTDTGNFPTTVAMLPFVFEPDDWFQVEFEPQYAQKTIKFIARATTLSPRPY